MYANILVFAVSVAAVLGHDHHPYQYKTVVHHEAPKEYRHPYEHQIRVQPEPSSSEEYKLPEDHSHAYSSQSHHHGLSSYQGSHEVNTEHVAPVYQYVNEQEEQHEPPKQKYHSVQYPVPAQHEVKTIRLSAALHHKPQAHYPESHEAVYHGHHHAPVHHAPPHHELVHHAPAHEESHESHDEIVDYYAYPKYQYEYKVEDPHTGDNKFQHEYRDGDVVKGVYGLHEADGSIRTVEYSSDKHNGFSAIVKHSSPGQHVHIESHHQH